MRGGAGHHGADIGQRLLRLLVGIASMTGLVANNAGGARDEQRGFALRLHEHGAGKGRTARTVLRRVVVGADLARVLHGLPGLSRREKINHQRTTLAAQRAGGGDLRLADAAPAGDEGIVAADAEFPVALEPVRVVIDVRKIIPHAKQVAIAAAVEVIEDPAIGLISGGFEIALFGNFQATEKDLPVARGGNAVRIITHHRRVAGPHLKYGVTSQQGQGYPGKGVVGGANGRPLMAKSDHAQHMPGQLWPLRIEFLRCQKPQAGQCRVPCRAI